MTADFFPGCGFFGHLLKYYPMILNHHSDFPVNKVFLPALSSAEMKFSL